ncbi:MAG: 16S rRNA (guanine(527)-N(7))-methyltransferase RsmG [Ruminococcus sp.]|nr:16S rRNA (guanine(527)-N(7))-methyltransferase RsmG [Ruminococcus sp.]
MLPDFEFCCDAFKKYGFELSNDNYKKFCAYSDYLVEYNKNVNLTAITEPMEILYKHFIDSIMITRYIDIPFGASLIDVGTGAGFPSVPIKIIRPDINLTLLDSLNKRIVFLDSLCNILEIDAQLIHGRAEDFSKKEEFREKYDFACARAVTNMSLLSELCIPFVRVGGKFISMKGPTENISIGYNAIEILGGIVSRETNYTVEAEERRIIEISKISQTPTKYPRNSSQIKKKLL